MPDKISKLQRWLDLVAYLAGRRYPVSAEQLWSAIPAYAEGLEGGSKDPETVRRMFERDKDELREMGIPIETVTFHIDQGTEESHGYRLAIRDFHLPYLRLVREAEAEAGKKYPKPPPPREFMVRDEEAGAALEGLRDVASLPGFPLRREARSAFRKLAFDLDPDLLRPAPVVYAEDPETKATVDALRTLSDALLAHKKVQFLYRSMERDDEAVRTVHPYGLLFQHGRWYLVAWAEDRAAVRMFRVGRMAGVKPNPRSAGTPDYEIPGDFDLRAYSGRKAWELGEGPGAPIQARVWFRFPRSLWADRNGHGTPVHEDEHGNQVRQIPVHRPEPFLRWVLSLEGDARVEGPDDLRDAFRSMVDAVARRYEPQGKRREDPEKGGSRG
ncbi:MAG: WYL domain-containing protein [Longimicrobiales bacterium]|nr:WYL domain-containing protein [Longimicrobiales bacterium]